MKSPSGSSDCGRAGHDPRTFARRFGWRWGGACVLLAAMAGGCAIYDQVQYFAAEDPNTGVTNYYKMTISGWGGLGTDYHFQAGYFSSEAVDVLRGSMPDIPILDLPVEQIEMYDALTDHFYAALLQEAECQNPITSPRAKRILARDRKQRAEQRLETLSADLKRLAAQLVLAEDQLVNAKTLAETACDKLDEEKAKLKELSEALDRAGSEDLEEKRNEWRKAREAFEEHDKDCDSAETKRAQAERMRDDLQAGINSLIGDIAIANSQIEEANNPATEANTSEDGEKKKACDCPACKGLDEEAILKLTRLIWLGSLSKSDLASMGATQNTNRYEFRKLVYWTTANNIDLKAYASEIEGVLDNVMSLAMTFKTQAKKKKAQARFNRKNLTDLVNRLPIGQAEKDALKAAIGFLVPPEPPSPANDAAGDQQ